MLLDIDHHSGVPIYRQVMDQIRDEIMAGHLKEGDRLMSVRELSSQLKVNPMTVSKAYSAMETEGLLERRRGIGLFVARIRDRHRERAREAVMEAVLTRAVTTALQFGLSEDQVRQLLSKLFLKYESEQRSAL